MIAGQFVGAFIGAILVYLAYLVHWGETEDPGLKLAVFSTGPGDPQHRREPDHRDHRHGVARVRHPASIGGARQSGRPDRSSADRSPPAHSRSRLLVLGIGMSLGGPTGYAINPARDLGPRIIHAILPIPGKGGSDWAYSWIPVVGPIIGGVIGAFLAKACFDLHVLIRAHATAVAPRRRRFRPQEETR